MTTSAMTCPECLGLVATADVAALAATTVAEHCAGCADCAAVVAAVAAEQRRFARSLDGMPPGVPSHVVAMRAVAGAAQARRRARRWRTAGVAAAAGVLLAAVAVGRDELVGSAPWTRTVELRCLAPERAAELARPIAPGVRMVFRPAAQLPVLTLQGPERDVDAAARQVQALDARWANERAGFCDGVAASRPAPARP